MSEVKFHIFTYQLSPKTNRQLELFGHQLSTQELISNKNKYFNDVIHDNLIFRSNKNLLNYKLEYFDNDFILLRLANKRTVSIERDFHREYFDSEPSSLVAIYNDPKIQILCIESDRTSFGSSFSVLKILEKEFDKKLARYHLNFDVQPKFEERLVWNLLKKYEGRVEKLQFQFSKPNLARVYESLSDELKEASKMMNSSTTKLEFNAPASEVLENLNENNENLAGLVHASSEGAGPTKLKLKNIRQWESTENSVKSFEIENLEIESDPDTVLKFVETVKEILKGE